MEFVKVTEIEHYTDTLFRFKTERPSTFRFTAGEFTMIGMEAVQVVTVGKMQQMKK